MRGDGRGTFGESKSLLRGWKNEDISPRQEDIFGERLYCIRWVDTWTETDKEGNERIRTERHFAAPNAADLKREKNVRDILADRFKEWQEKGFLPARRIEPGAETSRLARERGWQYWHQLFTPRQLLIA